MITKLKNEVQGDIKISMIHDSERINQNGAHYEIIVFDGDMVDLETHRFINEESAHCTFDLLKRIYFN